jgi:hypothetical protein
MNEIERAIKDFKDFKQAGYTHSELPSSWHIELALAALREKAEREKGCDWCQQKHNRYLFTQIADLNAETPIACPWCGKRLEVEHE